jgi:hypothetical protein
MGKFINKGNLGLSGQDCFNVHLFHGNAVILLSTSRNDFQAFSELRDLDTAMRFQKADDHIYPFTPKTLAFLEHLIGFSYSRAITEVDLQPPPLGAPYHPKKSIRPIFNHDLPCQNNVMKILILTLS